MLTFRILQWGCLILPAALVLLLLQGHTATWMWIPLVLMTMGCIGTLAWGATNIRSGLFLKTVNAADTNEKVVALSFDDGPLPQYTPQILDILLQYEVPAAFFCIGKNISSNSALLERIHEEGHVIGNHTYTHDHWFDMFSAGRMLKELEQTDAAVKSATGLQPQLFRPPYGVTNPNLRKAVLKGNYIPVGWNIRSLDTTIREKDKLFDRISSRLKPGAVILLHDTCQITVDLLPILIRYIRTEGYRLERLDKMLNVKAYA